MDSPQCNDNDKNAEEFVSVVATAAKNRFSNGRIRRQSGCYGSRNEDSNCLHQSCLNWLLSVRRVTSNIGFKQHCMTLLIIVIVYMIVAADDTLSYSNNNYRMKLASAYWGYPRMTFTPTTNNHHQRASIQARMTDENDNGDVQIGQQQQQQQQTQKPTTPKSVKPSRFAQPQFQRAAPHRNPRRMTSSLPRSETTTDTSSSTISTKINSNLQPQSLPSSSSSTGSRSRPPPPPLSTTRTTPNSMIDRDRMWKRPTITSKSDGQKPSTTIEDLEQRLMQRYGTDMSKWTSGEFDDDDDDDDDDEEYEEDENARSPSVFDPWEDLPQASTPIPANMNDRAFNDDATVSKAELYQNPTKSSSMMRESMSTLKASTSTSSITSTTSKAKSSPLSAFGRRAEEVSSTPKPIIDLSHLITREPAGGRGTNMIEPPPTKASSAIKTTKATMSTLEEEKTSTVVRSSTQPILDSNGIPMLLTIEQAQRLFDEQIEQNDASISNTVVESESEILPATPATWQDLGITNSLIRHNLNRINCEYPLPAQRTSCPNIVTGTNDVIIGTYTGSGKTLAFLVPIIQRILQQKQDDQSVFDQKSGYVKLMIVAPGRELASQIATVTRTLIADVDLSCMLAIGGTTFTRNLEQIRKRKPDILIGTPGRLAELMIGTTGSDIGNSNMKRGGRVPINNVQAIVLDEFDALLSYPPHSDPVHALMEFVKRNRGNDVQTVMCSATASDMMIQQKKGGLLEEKYLRPGYVFAVADADDILVTALNSDIDVNRNVTRTTRVSRTVMHGVVHVPHKRFALDTLRRILHTEPIPQQILIFVSDSRKVGIVVEKLADVGIIAAPLHGGMDSEKMDRAEVSRALREGYVGIVVSTEMAARGLDAPLLTHVINMDLPTDSSHYAHRAGRCGRGGRPGVVINLTTSPQERGVPIKLADQLGVKMYTVEVKNAKLNVVDPKSQILDGS